MGIPHPGGAPQPQQGQAQPPPVDEDVSEAIGCFANLKRFGHYGPISNACVLSYEPSNVSLKPISQFFRLLPVVPAGARSDTQETFLSELIVEV